MKIYYLLFFLVSALLIFFLCTSDFYYTRYPELSTTLATQNERFVIDRLITSNRSGIFSYGGLLGELCALPTESNQFQSRQHDTPYRTHCSQPETADTGYYKQFWLHNGLQGTIYATIGALFNTDVNRTVQIAKLINGILFALLLALFLTWCAVEIDWLGALMGLLLVALSPHLILQVRNIFLPGFALLLPIGVSATMLFILRRRTTRITFFYWFVWLIGCAISIAIAGYYYFIAILCSAAIPFLYYAIVDRWTKKHIVKVFFSGLIAVGGAIIVTVVCLALQYRANGNRAIDIIPLIINGIQRGGYGEVAAHALHFRSSLAIPLYRVRIEFLQTALIRVLPLFGLGKGLEGMRMLTLFGVQLLLTSGILLLNAIVAHGMRINIRLKSLLRYKHIAVSLVALYSFVPVYLWLVLHKSFALRIFPASLQAWGLFTLPFVGTALGYVMRVVLFTKKRQ